jgi:hypothetical protein
VKVAVTDEMRAAGHHASFVYRDQEHPDGGRPDRVRIRSEEQLVDEEGEPGVVAAFESLREFSEFAS